MQKRVTAALASAALALAATGVAAAAVHGSETQRVNVSTSGKQANDLSGTTGAPAVSRGGRFVAFESLAKNLVDRDTNDADDIFVRDTRTGTTTRVSVSSSGQQGHEDSLTPDISANGRFVVFQSLADNLVPGDTNFARDIFVHDMRTGATTLVSAAADGGPSDGQSFIPSISSDGRFVAFTSSATNLVPGGSLGGSNLFVRDLRTGKTILAGVNDAGEESNAGSSGGSISADGNAVVFESAGTNLVPDDTNGAIDVFVRNLRTHTTVLASVAGDGTQGNGNSSTAAIDADGSVVVFASDATNLVGGDLNLRTDAFVRDLTAGTTELASVSSSGVQADGPSIGNGIGGATFGPAISGDGQLVVFDSAATNLVPGDTNTCTFYETPGQCPDIFVHDRATGATTRVSVSSDGAQGNDASLEPAIDVAGTTVAFFSAASNLVPGDTNTCSRFTTRGHCPDIFIHRPAR